jgi:hypothetical protein
MAIGKKTGGRTKGTPNAERKELNQLMAEKFPDYHPVIAMAEIANDELNDVDIRLTAHKEVSKYVAPQLKAIEISGSLATQVIRIAKIKK